METSIFATKEIKELFSDVQKKKKDLDYHERMNNQAMSQMATAYARFCNGTIEDLVKNRRLFTTDNDSIKLYYRQIVAIILFLEEDSKSVLPAFTIVPELKDNLRKAEELIKEWKSTLSPAVRKEIEDSEKETTELLTKA